MGSWLIVIVVWVLLCEVTRGLPVEWGEFSIMPWDLDALMRSCWMHGGVKVKVGGSSRES